ncbi:hypothetical protein CANARDRAFT_201502 [[Candida] arabinofermentans NRRL YB-2248]|uniref:Uncharacterized protein n=1 Tax=[Candida] arabinofermentans NRRL YB-2248 TaxID=983967 RepID=A0A1E4SXK3_9ASCO|nr:hypothetical protein CANARDRAFT_201502 [[Candida] arabinofermentans NRRL YB-2248]
MPAVYSIAFDEETNKRIIDRLKLKETYPDASNTLSIAELQANYNSLTYWIHQELKPKHHTLFAAPSISYLFWDGITKSDPTCENMHLAPNQGNKATQIFIDEQIAEGHLDPQVESTPGKVNQTLLVHGNYVHKDMQALFRYLIYFNSIQEGVFKYGNVKLLAWLTPTDVLKYTGITSQYRKSNSFIANCYADIDVIAYSNSKKDKKVERSLSLFKDAIKLPEKEGQPDVCLIEMQSNHNKCNVKHQEEFDFVVHKLCMLSATPISSSCKLLGPGADEYFAEVLPQNILKKSAADLTEHEMALISEEFYLWPFKPDFRMELYMEH